MISFSSIGPKDAIHVKVCTTTNSMLSLCLRYAVTAGVTTLTHSLTFVTFLFLQGKHLYKSDGLPFFVKGIAFPTPPETLMLKTHGYNATAWLDVLQQLRDLDLEFNTVRLYRMYPETVDYHEFLEGAAKLGVYVIVPLTSASGAGVLDRTLHAPYCYKKKLFRYGTDALRIYLQYPNVLAGMVGNEVMNDEKAWQAAPCIRAYARDLKLFMDRMVDKGVFNRTLPLIYAAQDSSMIGGADMNSDTVMKLTVDYLTCVDEEKGTVVADVAGNESSHAVQRFEENKFGQSPIDIFGVNIESWCSSTQNFRYNPYGTPGSYYSLWKALRNTSIPIIFSEMGCPHSHFDRDDKERVTPEGTRDWAQVSIVTNEMADSWSGFIAYTYDGPKDFTMFEGGNWNGRDILSPTKDFYNFKYQLKKISLPSEKKNSTNISQDERSPPRQCADVKANLLSCCNLRMFNDDVMRSYSKRMNEHSYDTWFLIAISAVFGVFFAMRRGFRFLQCWKSHEAQHIQNGPLTASNGTKYMSI